MGTLEKFFAKIKVIKKKIVKKKSELPAKKGTLLKKTIKKAKKKEK